MDSYVSSALRHFVGRSLANDNDRFDLLTKIISEGKLRANIKNPDEPSISSTWGYAGERLGEVFQKCDCVCFCDIPDDLLGIHTRKYSKFGIAFNKTFLVKNGARPVTYVPLHASIKKYFQTDIPADTSTEYFVHLSNLSNTLFWLLIILNRYEPINESIEKIMLDEPAIKRAVQTLDSRIVHSVMEGKTDQMLRSLVSGWVTQLAYVKIFDETLADDDPDNYYMEREWRSIRSVDFSIDDIEKIYLPSTEYVEKFKKVFPQYHGEFYILQ